MGIGVKIGAVTFFPSIQGLAIGAGPGSRPVGNGLGIEHQRPLVLEHAARSWANRLVNRKSSARRKKPRCGRRFHTICRYRQLAVVGQRRIGAEIFAADSNCWRLWPPASKSVDLPAVVTDEDGYGAVSFQESRSCTTGRLKGTDPVTVGEWASSDGAKEFTDSPQLAICRL